MKDIKESYKKTAMSGCACDVLHSDLNVISPDQAPLAIQGMWEGIKVGVVSKWDSLKDRLKPKLSSFLGRGVEDCTNSFVFCFTEFRARFPEANDELDEVAKEIASDLIDMMMRYSDHIDYEEIEEFLGNIGVAPEKVWGQQPTTEFVIRKFCNKTLP